MQFLINFLKGCKEAMPWFVAAGTVLSSALAANAIWDFARVSACGKGWGPLSWTVAKVGFIAAFFVFVCLLFLQRHAFRPRTKTLKKDFDFRKREALVIFLSHLDEKQMEGTGWRQGVPKPLGENLTGELKSDILKMVEYKNRKDKTGPRFWPWEMPMRAIRRHVPVLECVYVLCSEQSIKQLHWFVKFCKRYKELDSVLFFTVGRDSATPSEVDGNTPCREKGLDFDDFDKLSDAMWVLLQHLKKEKVAEKKIMVDFTGGTKVASVVAASMTFNRRIKAQYVQTRDCHRVASYDVVQASADTEGLGK